MAENHSVFRQQKAYNNDIILKQNGTGNNLADVESN